MYFLDGTIVEGEWENGQLKEESKKQIKDKNGKKQIDQNYIYKSINSQCPQECDIDQIKGQHIK